MSNTSSVSLTIDFPDGSTKVMEFTSGDPIMIGSGESASVRIEHEDVSSLHAMIKPKDDGYVVLDLGSDEGTEVNGREINGETPIDDGDHVQLGAARVTVHFGGAMLDPTVPIRSGLAVGHQAPADEKTTPQNELPDDTVDMPTVEGGLPDRAEAVEPEDKTVKAPPPDETQPAGDTAEAPAGPGTSQGMPISERHDDTRGHHLQARNLTPELGEKEKPQNTGHVDVTMLWGGTVMGVQRLSGGGALRVGHSPTNDFQISHASIPSPAFELVRLSKDGAQVTIAQGMEATSNKGDVASGTHKLQLGEKVTIRVGPVEFVVQYSSRYRAIDLGLFQTLDFFYSKVLGVALIFQVTLVVAMLITPSFDGDEEDDLFKNPNEFSALILKQPEKKKEKKEDLSGKKGAKRKDDEGKFGKKDKPKEDKLASKKGAPKVDKDKREEDRKLAMDALAALGLKGPEGAVSNVLGPGGLGSGINNALGGLRGASMGDAGGAGGLGSRGTGAGGGGNALGIGGLGSGNGRGSGGRGGIDLGGRGKGMTRIKPGKVIHKGSLSREEIARVVRRHLNQIRYCYEKQLAKDPNLQGKLVGSWTIAGTGLVASASITQNTMGSPPVGKCVERIIKRMRFPRPKGGGQVFVTYPFVFAKSGG
jgi:predicted component of type VI protein secretion system